MHEALAQPLAESAYGHAMCRTGRPTAAYPKPGPNFAASPVGAVTNDDSDPTLRVRAD